MGFAIAFSLQMKHFRPFDEPVYDEKRRLRVMFHGAFQVSRGICGGKCKRHGAHAGVKDAHAFLAEAVSHSPRHVCFAEPRASYSHKMIMQADVIFLCLVGLYCIAHAINRKRNMGRVPKPATRPQS